MGISGYVVNNCAHVEKVVLDAEAGSSAGATNAIGIEVDVLVACWLIGDVAVLEAIALGGWICAMPEVC